MRRYLLFGSPAKSILTSEQGAFGSGDITSCSRLDSGVETKHAQHDWTLFSTISSIPGNHTFSLKSDLVFTIFGDLRGQGLLRALVAFWEQLFSFRKGVLEDSHRLLSRLSSYFLPCSKISCVNA